ncbi:MAG: ABC transporter substrate-binding protein [Chloroflexi bacterium]|nr:ABC transporter substrate-binding protein [Chloroflexota bacterium]
MRRQILLSGASCLTSLGLFIISCAQPAPPTSLSKTTPPAKAPVAETLAPRPVAPTSTPRPTAEQPKYGGTLLLVNKTEPYHFDLHQESAVGVVFPLAPAYNLVVQNDPMDDTKIIGDLAKTWEVSADGLTYTFHINEGVKFHDGTLLTSKDIKYNLDRIVSPPKGTVSLRKELFRALERIETTDPATLKATLKYPQASFLQLLALPYNVVFAPSVIEKKGDMKKDVMGTGPFKFSNYVDRVSFSVKRNPDYFINGRPYLDGITVYMVFDDRTRMAAWQTKRVHALPLSADMTPAAATELKRSEPGSVMYERAVPGVASIVPNTRAKPWDDVRVRQALNLAMDRELGGKVIRGGYFPGYGYTTPGGKWSLPEKELMAMPGYRKPKDQDIAEARRLLAEAGYPEGLRFKLSSSRQPHHAETAEFSKDQLARIGITVDIQFVDQAVNRQVLLEGKFEVTVSGDASAVDDPDILLGEGFLTGSPKNWGFWSNSKFDALYEEQTKTMDTQKRLELVWEMQRLLHREGPRIIIAWAKRFAVMWPEVRDWLPARSHFLNNKFQDVWLAK